MDSRTRTEGLERTLELIHSRTRLRSLASELTLTEQRERQRLATDLHDYLAQLLVFGRIKLSQAKRDPKNPWSGSVPEELDEVLGKALTYIRYWSAKLGPLCSGNLDWAWRWSGWQSK